MQNLLASCSRDYRHYPSSRGIPNTTQGVGRQRESPIQGRFHRRFVYWIKSPPCDTILDKLLHSLTVNTAEYW